MRAELEQLLSTQPLLWRGGEQRLAQGQSWPVGFAALAELIPGGAWPGNALLELIVPRWGMGELQLLLPALRSATRAGRRLVLVGPPYVPYAPALAAAGIDLARVLILRVSADGEIAWAMEQVLRQPAAAVVLAWPGSLRPLMIRRLQLAAEAGANMGVLLLPRACGRSAAALRLGLQGRDAGLRVEILKMRGHCRQPWVDISFSRTSD